MISAVLLKDRLKKQTMAGENSALQAFERAEEAFAGEAVKAGFETEADMQNYMREIRKEVRR